ncbi:MAG: cupin domain-containing protein [Proteobacteria bacterium]|nr:cupin domain-containing protein [Pseudomonadota bacterium]MBI3499427.1 cupin domain-containing protein [Pseudomonadota bacterium]
MEKEMGNRTPGIIDLTAELAKLTMFRGLTPQTKRAERRGSGTQLGPYRDGILIAGKSAGTSHWETHPDDELVHVLDGTKTLEIVCDDGPPKSFVLRAGMIAVVPRGAWHRFQSSEGGTTWSATLPGDHIELDVNDPRTVEPKKVITTGTPSIIDLNQEVAKLKMFRRAPNSTAADREGSVAQLASYRDGLLLAIKSSGKDHWERHLTGDELVHILDGTATLDIVCDDGPPKSFELRTGMIAVIPQGAWHRLLSSQGATQMAVTPFPGEHIELDVDDPRTVERKPA